MSFIRTAIIVSVAVAAMPSDPESQKRLYERTAAAVHWTVTFCDRNPATCTNAGEYWDAFLTKAQFTRELAYQTYENYTASETDGAPYANATYSNNAAHRFGTLTREDLRPSWRGPVRRQGI